MKVVGMPIVLLALIWLIPICRQDVIRVTVVKSTPFVIFDTNSSTLSSSESYSGLCIDLISRIARELNHTIEYTPSKDGRYGIFDPLTEQWSGMIGMLLNHEADLAVGQITITPSRMRVVDFSSVIMDSGLTAVLKKQKLTGLFFRVLLPYAFFIWGFSLLVYVLISAALLRLAHKRLDCNSGLNSPCPTTPIKGPTGSLIRGFKRSRNHIERVVITLWWICTGLLVSLFLFTAVCFLVSSWETKGSPINSMRQLREQSDIQYGAISGGSTFAFFNNSKSEPYRSMGMYMKENANQVLIANVAEGVQKALTENYAFIMESIMAEYYIYRECDLKMLAEKFNVVNYAFAAPKGYAILPDISAKIEELQKSGYIAELQETWIKQYNTKQMCTAPVDESIAFDYVQIFGLILSLLVGLTLSALICWIVLTLLKYNQRVRHSTIPPTLNLNNPKEDILD